MSIEAEGSGPRTSRLKAGDGGEPTDEKASTLSSGALIRFVPEEAGTAGWRFAVKPSQAMIASAVALVLGGGFVAGAAMLGSKAAPTAAVAQMGPPPETTASLLHKVEDEVHTLKVGLDSLRANAENTRQDEAIRGLKKSVDVLKQDLEVAKASNASAVAQVVAKLDRLDRDPTPKLAEISSRLDQMKADQSSPKLAEITARLDRIEHQISSPTATGSIAAPARTAAAPLPVAPPTPTAAVEPKAAPKPATVEGWMLRDVYGGVALLEGRAGGLREVAPGQFLPGVGQIQSIERRGRSWVVVTSRGIIEADNRW